MPDIAKVFRNRTEIAAHLHMSRMEIWRLEQLFPLTTRKGCHVFFVTPAEVTAWFEHACDIRYGRKAAPTRQLRCNRFNHYPRRD